MSYCNETGDVLCVYRDVQVLSCDHCRYGKAICSLLHILRVCVCVALVTQHAVRMRHTVICGLPVCTVFFVILSHKRHDFRKKKKVVEHKACVLFSSTTVDYTECPRRNGQYFGRVFLMLKYTDITQNTYIQS